MRSINLFTKEEGLKRIKHANKIINSCREDGSLSKIPSLAMKSYGLVESYLKGKEFQIEAFEIHLEEENIPGSVDVHLALWFAVRTLKRMNIL